MLQSTESCRQPLAALRIGFWLTHAFDLYALANALEPLRPNQLAGRSVCQWHHHALRVGSTVQVVQPTIRKTSSEYWLTTSSIPSLPSGRNQEQTWVSMLKSM